MINRRLLKRLTDDQSAIRKIKKQYDIADEVAFDIQSFLNTHRGNALIDPSMGMPDMKGFFQSHSDIDQDHIASEISDQITRFESRIDSHTIEFDERDSHSARLSWIVNAKLSEPEARTINLRLFITEDGYISVIQLA